MCEPLVCEACGVLQERAMALVTEQEDALVMHSRTESRLRKMIDSLRKANDSVDPEVYEAAMEVALYWKKLCAPRAREVEGPRLEKTIARLKRYPKEELKKAVFGYSCKPHRGEYGKRLRIGEGGKWDADLADIMRDSKHVDAGIRLAEEEARYDQGVLNQGGRRMLAELCDCGHPRVEHGLLWMQGHDACYAPECRCTGFDDINQRSEEWLRQHNYELTSSAPNAMNGQGTLL